MLNFSFSFILILVIFITYIEQIFSNINNNYYSEKDINEFDSLIKNIQISFYPKDFIVNKFFPSFTINFRLNSINNGINLNNNIVIKNNPICSLEEFNIINNSTILNNNYALSSTSEITGICINDYNSLILQRSSFNIISTEISLTIEYQSNSKIIKQFVYKENINFYFLQIIDYYPKILSIYSKNKLYIALSNDFKEDQIKFIHNNHMLDFEKLKNEKGIYFIKDIDDVNDFIFEKNDYYYHINIEIKLENTFESKIININVINDINKYFAKFYFINSNSVIIQKNTNIQNNYIYNELFKYINKCELYLDKYNINIIGNIYKNINNSLFDDVDNNNVMMCVLENKNNNMLKDFSIINCEKKLKLISDYFFVLKNIETKNVIKLDFNYIKNNFTNKVIYDINVNDDIFIEIEQNIIYFYKNNKIIDINLLFKNFNLKICDITYCSYFSQNNINNNKYILLNYIPKEKLIIDFYPLNNNLSQYNITKIINIKNSDQNISNNRKVILNETEEYNQYKFYVIKSYIQNYIYKKINIKLISYDLKNHHLLFIHDINKKFINEINQNNNNKIKIYCNINNIYKKEILFNKDGMIICEIETFNFFEKCKNKILFFDLLYNEMKYYKNITKNSINLCEELEKEKKKLINYVNNDEKEHDIIKNENIFKIIDYWPKIFFYNNNTLNYDYIDYSNNNYFLFKIDKNNSTKDKSILINNFGKWSINIKDKYNSNCEPFIQENFIKCNINYLNKNQIRTILYRDDINNLGNILPEINIILKEELSNNKYNISIKQIPYNFFNIKLIIRNNSLMFYFEGYYLLNDTDLYCNINNNNNKNLFSKIINNSCIFTNTYLEKIYKNKNISIILSYIFPLNNNITYNLYNFIIDKRNIIFENNNTIYNDKKTNVKDNLNNISITDNIVFINENNSIIINGYFSHIYEYISYKLFQNNIIIYEDKCRQTNNYQIICSIMHNLQYLYFPTNLYLYFDNNKLNKILFLFDTKLFFNIYTPKVSLYNFINNISTLYSYILLIPNNESDVQYNILEIKEYLNLYIDIDNNDINKIEKKCIIENNKNIILCRATKKDLDYIIENKEIIFNINNLTKYKYNFNNKNSKDFLKEIQKIKNNSYYNKANNDENINNNKYYRKKNLNNILYEIDEIVMKDKNKILFKEMNNTLSYSNDELIYNRNFIEYNFFYYKQFIKVFPTNLNKNYERNKFFNYSFEIQYLFLNNNKNIFNINDNYKKINNSFECVLLDYINKEITLISKAIYNNITNNFYCPNLYCLSKGIFLIEIHFFYSDIHSQILLNNSLICNEPENYINNTNNISNSKFFNNIQNISAFDEEKKINNINSYLLNKSPINPAFISIYEKRNINNKTKKSYDKYNHEWESRSVILNDSDYIINLDNENLYIDNDKKIVEISQVNIPNIYYSNNQIKKIEIKILGESISKKELLFIKFTSDEDNNKYQIIRANITEIDSKNNIIIVECNIPNNNIFLKNKIYLQVSQNNFNFKELNKSKDFYINFIDNIFIEDIEPRLINFEGNEKINIKIKDNNSIENGLINKNKLICIFKYGLSITIKSELKSVGDSNVNYYCQTIDFSTYIKNIKQYFIELTIKSEENNLIESNIIEIKMYYNYLNNETCFDIYPHFLLFSLNNNSAKKGFLIKLNDINNIESNNNFMSNLFYNIYCGLTNNNDINIILDNMNNNKVIHNNSTIYCNLNYLFNNNDLFNTMKTYLDNNLVLSLDVLFSVNKGNKWETTYKNIFFYIEPTFEGINNISHLLNDNNQNEKYFLIEIKGNNFINISSYINIDNNNEKYYNNISYCLFVEYNNNDFQIFSELIYISKNIINCKLNYNNIYNKYKIYISYNSGEEIIDTGLIFSYETQYYIKSIKPPIDNYNFNQNENINQYTLIDIYKDLKLTDNIIINNNEYNCFLNGIFDNNNFFQIDSNLKCYYPTNYYIYNNIIYNYTPFRYTNIEFGRETFLYSDSNITYFLLNIIIEEISPLLIPFNQQTTVRIKGKNFINKISFKLISTIENREILIENNYIFFINSTLIEFNMPSLDENFDNKYNLFYTINGDFFYKHNSVFNFYPQLTINNISPNEIFGNERTILIIYSTNLINNNLLTCKVGSFYTTHCEFISENSCKCEIPEYTYLINGETNYSISNINNNYLSVGLSNNGQSFVYYNYLHFKTYIFLDSILDINYYPKYGPETGGSNIHIDFGKNFNKYLNKNIISKCLFGNFEIETEIIYINDETSPYINCISPNLNLIDEKYIEKYKSSDLNDIYLNYEKINITIIIEELNFNLEIAYIYNTNITIYDYIPNNVDYQLKNKIVNLELYTNSIFYFLSNNIKCRFSFLDNDNNLLNYDTNATYNDFQMFTCPIPKPDEINSYIYANFSFSLNGFDFYDKNNNNENIIIYYRQNEEIISINMTNLPLLSKLTNNLYRKINISLDYYEDGDYSQSYCIITDNKFVSNSNFIIYIKSEDYNSNDNKICCLVPNDIYLLYKNNSLLPEENKLLYIGVSSNKNEYIEPLKEIYLYLKPIIKNCNKYFFSIYNLFNIELNGENFINIDTLKIIITCNNIDHYYYLLNGVIFENDSKLKINNINLNDCQPYQLVNIKLTYDDINYSPLQQNIITYKLNRIKNYYPSLIILGKTKQIILRLNESIYGNQKYKCKFVYNNYIIMSDGLIFGDDAIICNNIDSAFNNININSNEEINMKLSILINEEDIYLFDEINLYFIKSFDFHHNINNNINNYLSIKKLEFNLYQMNNLNNYNIKYYLKIGDILIIPFDEEASLNNNIIFTINDYFIENNIEFSEIFISPNLNDWYSTSINIKYNNNSCIKGKKCFDYKTTIYSNIINNEICRKGFYCLNGIEIKCEIGNYNNIENQDKCYECPIGKICNKLNLINPIECPKGFLCSNQNILSLSLASPCPKGFYCPSYMTQYNCPKGKYCPIATGYFDNTFEYKYYNIFGYPQPCKSGYICDNENNNSINQFGTSLCTIGNFCQFGIQINCSINSINILSFECQQKTQLFPFYCIPGTYKLSTNMQDFCILCPLGSICSEEGTNLPQYCPPGRICEYSGLYRPSEYCPGGYYCRDSIIGFPTKNPKPENSKEFLYYPQLCDKGQLCLLGITNPITNEFDPESPQPCIPGMVCEEGSSGTSSLDQCPRGYYCPGDAEPIPAEPGYYVPGTGFISPLQCPPGYFSNTTGSDHCNICEKGTYNYLQAQTECSLCEPGSYCEENSDHIICSLCPEGTYNPKRGSFSRDDCISCPKGFLCDLEGMYDFESQSKICPSGYICAEGTNNNNIMLCPPGFYCEQGTGEKYQFHICVEGYYCDQGSTLNNNKKNPCLEGYYCPYGTYLDFDNILKISPLLDEIIEEKLSYNPYDEEVVMIRNAQCDENLILNPNIVQKYLNDNNLKCPKGTTSKEGAVCLGQCIKDTKPYLLIDPLDENDYIIENENNRRLQDINIIEEKKLILRPYEIIYILFDFSKVPSYMIFNQHYSILIEIDDEEIEIDEYIKESIQQKVLNGKQITLRIFNYNQDEKYLKVNIELNNEIYFSESSSLEKTGSIIRVIPSRNEFFTNKIFPFIIFQSTFIDTRTVSSNFKTDSNTISLPFNFIIPNQIQYLVSLAELNIDKKNIPESYSFYDHGFYNNDPYSPSLFENNNLQYIFMPFFPYISNCYGYDKYLYFFDLLQNSSDCNLINYQNIKIVTYNPFKGIKPSTDSCEINLVCKYDELDQNAISSRWFSLLETSTLAYTTQEPIDISKTFEQNYFGENFDLDNIDKIPGLIDINFIPHRDGNYNENCFPNRIEININYYHVNQKKKKLYNIEVNMYDYINCKDSTYSDDINSNKENNDNSGIYNNTNYDGVYSLKISYKPMNYMSLMDYYQFSYEFYFILIFFLSLTFFSLIIFILFILKKKRNKKFIKFLTLKTQKLYIKYFFGPFIKGIFYGILILLSLISIIIFNKELKVFYNYSPTWDYLDSGGFESDVENNYYSNARVSLYFILTSIYLFYLAINRSVPMPDESFLMDSNKEKIFDELNKLNKEKDLENSKENHYMDENDNENEDNEFNKKKDISLSSDELSEKNEDENKVQFYDDEEVKITTTISWKKRMVFIKYLLCLSWIMFKNMFIHYNKNLIQSFLMFFIDISTEEFFLKFIFSEALLAAPLLVLNKTMRFIILVENGEFNLSSIIYCTTLFIDSFIIIFLLPLIDRIEFLISSKIHLLKLKYVNKFIYKLINKIVIVNNYLYNEDKWKEEYEKEIFKYLNKKDELSLEPILRINYIISVKLMSILFKPITLLIFYKFKEETKIKELFSLKEDKIYIHFFFLSIYLIIPEIILLMILTNIIQIYYNINNNDYLEFCNFRYNIRESDFINMRDTMEYGINKFWRSLDSYLFSEQYYLNLFISTSCLLYFFIGLLILSSYNYNPFGEPYLIFIVMIFIVCILVFHYILIRLFKFIFGVFVQKNPPINKRTGRILEFLKMGNYIQNMTKSMTTKMFRNKFVKVNKTWIIENLTYILGIEEDVNNYLDEKQKGQFETKKELDLKLQQIYQDALNYEFIEKEIQHKKELIKRDLQLMPYNQEYVGEINKNFGIRLDISKDSNSDLPSLDIVSKLKKLDNFFEKKENINLKKRIIDIAHIWKNKAKEILRYKKWSVDVIKRMKKNKCQKCSSDFNLQVFQNIPFEELVNEFKKINKGEESGVYKWQKYFEKKQIFVTLCIECAYIRNTQMVINKYLASDNNKDSKLKKIENKILAERLKKNHIKGIALNWLYVARSKILIRKIDRQLKEDNNITKKKNE